MSGDACGYLSGRCCMLCAILHAVAYLGAEQGEEVAHTPVRYRERRGQRARSLGVVHRVPYGGKFDTEVGVLPYVGTPPVAQVVACSGSEVGRDAQAGPGINPKSVPVSWAGINPPQSTQSVSAVAVSYLGTGSTHPQRCTIQTPSGRSMVSCRQLSQVPHASPSFVGA
jgi:hypothetical protein